MPGAHAGVAETLDEGDEGLELLNLPLDLLGYLLHTWGLVK